MLFLDTRVNKRIEYSLSQTYRFTLAEPVDAYARLFVTLFCLGFTSEHVQICFMAAEQFLACLISAQHTDGRSTAELDVSHFVREQ